MNRGGDTRFRKGQSGNPSGRPKARRPHVSAFDIIFDQVLTVTQNGVERELTVDEALQLQTYQAALRGRKMAIRTVLKMIEKREAALAKRDPAPVNPVRMECAYDSDSANKAMEILGIAGLSEPSPGGGPGTRRFQLQRWVTQAAISRPGRKTIDAKDIEDIKRCTMEADMLRWPRPRR